MSDSSNVDMKTGVLMGLIASPLILLLLIYGIAVGGFEACCFWNWFIAPLSELIPTVSYAQGIGISCFTWLLLGDCQYAIKSEYKMDNLWATNVVKPWLYLLIGYLVHVFVV